MRKRVHPRDSASSEADVTTDTGGHGTGQVKNRAINFITNTDTAFDHTTLLIRIKRQGGGLHNFTGKETEAGKETKDK